MSHLTQLYSTGMERVNNTDQHGTTAVNGNLGQYCTVHNASQDQHHDLIICNTVVGKLGVYH